MRKVLLIILMNLALTTLSGQGLINVRTKLILLPCDSIQLDSLSIVPGSFSIKDSYNAIIPDSLYEINYENSTLFPGLYLKNTNDSLKAFFRVFPISWIRPLKNKDLGFNRIDPAEGRPLSLYRPPADLDPFSNSELSSNGNISRGLMIGNTRDPSLSSNLHLQLSGKINKDFMIEANLSDSNIPIQPEGNTQQIQDFDQLYIRIYNPKNEILGGDFVIESPSGYFLNMNKKVQGARITSRISENATKKTKITSSLSGAVVKGKYNILKIQGQERNQGPYRLSGKNGESYIQVIAGSEKVYIDGELLIRGEQNDYVIDYNTAELRFTPKKLITKDKRIIIEFEYTEQSYARFMVLSSTNWKRERGSWYFNMFSEQDAKNQALLQDLNEEQKGLLSRVGDKTDQALSLNYFPVDFRNDRVLYKLSDSLVNGIRYDSILIYSINPDSAKYQAGFSFAGDNNGNYVAVSSAANGQVYKWVAPVDGIPQGNYAPYTKLIAPQSKQVFSAGGTEKLGSRMEMSMDLALTRNDLNSFSSLDQNDNIGYGIKSGLKRLDPISSDSSWSLQSEIEFSRISNHFDPVERYRPVEFERDWNLVENGYAENENFLTTRMTLLGKDNIMANYQLEYLSYSELYKATRHLTGGDMKKKGWSLTWNGSHMSSNTLASDGKFSRHNIDLAKDLSIFKIYARENHEGNIRNNNDNNNPGVGSFKFQEWEFGLENSGKTKMPWYLRFTNRTDFLPANEEMKRDSRAWQINSGIDFTGKKGNKTAFSASWRELKSYTGNFEGEENGQTLTARIEENIKLLRGAVISRTFYEIGSGLERKMEYTYIEVAAGQGYYTWTDYNQNGNKELDEFEPAHFRDQANFIRVFRPGTEYIPTYQNRFNQIINIQAGKFFAQESIAYKFMSRFSNSLAFRIDKKSYRTNLADQLNPFQLDINDSILVSNNTQLRNSLSFNKNSSIFGADYHHERNQSQVLLSYGTDKRSNIANRLTLRIKPLDTFWISNLSEAGEKTYTSSFFTNKNYLIDYLKNDIDFNFKPGDNWQTGISHEWRKEESTDIAVSMNSHRIEAGVIYQMPAKGQIQLKVNYLAINFSGDPGSPIGYVMLQGFQPGNNGLLNLSIRRKLNKVIQLDFTYEGRVSEGSGTIHTGNVQVRAIF